MLGAAYCHSVSNGFCIACLAFRRGGVLSTIQVETGGILVPVRAVHNAVPQDGQCDQESDTDDDGKCCDHL